MEVSKICHYTHPKDFKFLKLFEYYSYICIVLHLCAYNAQKVYCMRIAIGNKLGNEILS